jgi:hypothetical protein
VVEMVAKLPVVITGKVAAEAGGMAGRRRENKTIDTNRVTFDFLKLYLVLVIL